MHPDKNPLQSGSDALLLQAADSFYCIQGSDNDCFHPSVTGIPEPVRSGDHQTLQNALSITEGQDYVSLFTCTPYGVNSHRLIVRGHRVEYNGEEDVKQSVGAFFVAFTFAFSLMLFPALTVFFPEIVTFFTTPFIPVIV